LFGVPFKLATFAILLHPIPTRSTDTPTTKRGPDSWAFFLARVGLGSWRRKKRHLVFFIANSGAASCVFLQFEQGIIEISDKVPYNYAMKQDIYQRSYKAKIAATKGRRDRAGNPIEFQLTFEQWCQLWQESGHLPQFPYVISRRNDLGHYKINNVFIQHTMFNLCDAHNLQSDLDKKITAYAIENNYKRRIVKAMLDRGQIEL
jgi:hypothetical protein